MLLLAFSKCLRCNSIFLMATTTNSYQLSIVHDSIVTTKTPPEASQLLRQHQSHKVATTLLPRTCVNRLYRKLCYCRIYPSIGINRLTSYNDSYVRPKEASMSTSSVSTTGSLDDKQGLQETTPNMVIAEQDKGNIKSKLCSPCSSNFRNRVF